MTVKIIGLIKLLDSAAFEGYRNKVGITVAKHGGQVRYRGTLARSYWNELACEAFDTFVELEFPTLEDAAQWTASDDYRDLLEVRRKAMKLTLFAVR